MLPDFDLCDNSVEVGGFGIKNYLEIIIELPIKIMTPSLEYENRI